MNPDIINSIFEFTGCIAIWLNIRQAIKDKLVRSVSYFSMGFFTIWSFWNLYYYSDLNQMWSFYASVIMVFSNTIYTSILVYYVQKENKNG